MKRAAMMMAMAMVVSAGITRAAQESVAVGPASPVQGGKVIKAKSMTAVGAVKTVAADSLTINDGPGKDWTFVIDATTKIIPRASQETLDVAPVSPVEGGKVMPSKPGAGQETIDVAPVFARAGRRGHSQQAAHDHRNKGRSARPGELPQGERQDARDPSSSDVAEPTPPDGIRPKKPRHINYPPALNEAGRSSRA